MLHHREVLLGLRNLGCISVEVTEADKQLDCLYTFGRFPILHSGQLGGVHMDLSVLYYQSEVFRFGEELYSFEFVNESRDKGERIGIFDSVFIEVAIVLARSKASIFLLNREEQGSLQ